MDFVYTAAYINVRKEYQPTKEDIADGFSLSAWVQVFGDTEGYILAKTNPDGSRHFYTLKLIANNAGTQIKFGYSRTGADVSIGCGFKWLYMFPWNKLIKNEHIYGMTREVWWLSGGELDFR